MAGEPSAEALKSISSVATALNLTFNDEQIKALVQAFELGADPDAMIRFLSQNSSFCTQNTSGNPLSHTGTPSSAAGESSTQASYSMGGSPYSAHSRDDRHPYVKQEEYSPR